MANENNTSVLDQALNKLAEVELTYDELAAVADAVLDDDVSGYGVRGVINWGQVGKVHEIDVVGVEKAGMTTSSLQECTISKSIETVPAKP